MTSSPAAPPPPRELATAMAAMAAAQTRRPVDAPVLGAGRGCGVRARALRSCGRTRRRCYMSCSCRFADMGFSGFQLQLEKESFYYIFLTKGKMLGAEATSQRAQNLMELGQRATYAAYTTTKPLEAPRALAPHTSRPQPANIPPTPHPQTQCTSPLPHLYPARASSTQRSRRDLADTHPQPARIPHAPRPRPYLPHIRTSLAY